MSWFKVDDKLWGHPKWLATPIRSKGLWVSAGAWAADQEQDGNIPRHVLPILGATVRDASGLVASGLWTTTDSGWLFHGWADFQPTREQKDAEREAARERMRAGRVRNAAKRAEDVRANNPEVRDVFGEGSEGVRDAPSRPDPTRPVPLTSLPAVPAGDDEVTSRRKPEIRLPASWAPTVKHYELATERHVDIAEQVQAFRNHADTHDRLARSWDAAFRTWLTKATPTAAATPRTGSSIWDRKPPVRSAS